MSCRSLEVQFQGVDPLEAQLQRADRSQKIRLVELRQSIEEGRSGRTELDRVAVRLESLRVSP